MACRARIKEKRANSHRCWHPADEILSHGVATGLVEDLDVDVNEFLMFHGTAPEKAKCIITTDFRMPRGDKAHGHLYGAGIYFAESNSKAHMYCEALEDAFPILVSRVTLGTIKNVTDNSPNAKALYDGAMKGDYDSVCGDRRNLKWNFSGYREFIVYNNDQALVEFLVWCTKVS